MKGGTGVNCGTIIYTRTRGRKPPKPKCRGCSWLDNGGRKCLSKVCKNIKKKGV